MLNFLYSIRARHMADILNGKKTYELRTKLPREMKEAIDRGEKVVLWGYCTKSKDELFYYPTEKNYYTAQTPSRYKNDNSLNGLVVFKCVVDEYIKIGFDDDFGVYIRDTEHLYNDFIKNACVTDVEFESYFYNKGGYALHLTQVEILDKPMTVQDFGLTRAPQSYQRVLAPEGK